MDVRNGTAPRPGGKDAQQYCKETGSALPRHCSEATAAVWGEAAPVSLGATSLGRAYTVASSGIIQNLPFAPHSLAPQSLLLAPD